MGDIVDRLVGSIRESRTEGTGYLREEVSRGLGFQNKDTGEA